MLKGRQRVDQNLMDRELDAIESDYIFCSTYTAMNDPMEGLYLASRRVRQSEDYERVVEEIQSEKLGLGIASLCETWNNELMWAHYANGFRGICVAYWVQQLIDTLPPAYALSRVTYDEKPYSISATPHQHRPDRARAVLSTKNIRWAYEREWRLFGPRPGRANHGPRGVAGVYLGARFPEGDQQQVVDRLRDLGVWVRQTQVDGYVVERVGLD